MAVQPPEIEAFPPTPQRKNKDTFANLFDDVISWFSRSVSKVGQACLSAYQNAVGAEASASAAAAAAESAISVAGATEWVSGKTYAKGTCVWSPATGATYRRRVAGAGTVDPSADLTNWSTTIQAGFSNMVVLRSTQQWTPPTGVAKAEITLIDGGTSGGARNYGDVPGGPGRGGNCSISVRSVSSATTYTATVGTGGPPSTAGSQTTNPGIAGGLSSFSGSGFTTLTTANGDLKIPGEQTGATFYAAATNAGGGENGQGGAGGYSSSSAGAAGVIVIRF